MAKRFFLTLFIPWVLTMGAYAQESKKLDAFADQAFYLFDSITLSQLSSSDQILLDSCLTEFHRANPDTSKIQALGAICESMTNDVWMKYQYLQYELIEDARSKDQSAETQKALLSSATNAINNLGYIEQHYKGNIPAALEYYSESLKMYEEQNNKPGIALGHNNIGVIYYGLGDIEKAIFHYSQSLKIREELGNQNEISQSLHNIASVYQSQGDIAKALEFNFRSLKIRERINDQKGISVSLNNIGIIYGIQKDYSKALELYNKSLEIRKNIGDQNGIAMALNNMASIYINYGDPACDSTDQYCKHQSIQKALELFKQSAATQRKIGDYKGLGFSLSNIGSIYKLTGVEDNTVLNDSLVEVALAYHQEAYLIRQELNNKHGMAASLSNIGGILLAQNKLFQARERASKGLKMALELGFPKAIRDHSKLLTAISKREGKHEEALKMYELHIQMRDSILNEKTQKATIRQQTKYEFEKAQIVEDQREKDQNRKAKEITQRRDNLQYSIILLCLLVLGTLVLALGKLQLSARVAEGLIFFAFLIFFEFILVLGDPYIESWTGGAPGLMLLINAGVAALIFPLHAFFEAKLKRRLVKNQAGSIKEV